MTDLGPNFYKRLLEVSNSVGMPPEFILNVIAVESSFDPSAGAGHSAAGLFQIMPKNLKHFGYQGTAADFRKEPPEVQLDYAEKLIKDNMNTLNGGKPFKSVTQYYVSHFLPAALKIPGVQQEDPNAIIASGDQISHLKGISKEFEKKYYKANSGLDLDKDESITYGELSRILASKIKQKSYLAAINDMKKYTGHNPKEKKQVQETQLAQKEPTKPKEIGFIATIENLLNDLLQRIRTAERKDKQLYKTFLPNNNFLIQVTAKDHFDAIEFSRILCLALEEELLAKAYTHINSNEVEVECNIYGAQKECFSATKQLIESIAETFKDATKKIGSIDIKTNLIINKKSSYQQITGLTAEKAYRRFLLKFALGK
jgi:hypothetical protein